MARRRPAVNAAEEQLALAAERGAELPAGELIVDYQPDADLLYVKLKDAPRPDRTESDLRAGVIRHYEGRRLVSVEVLDLYSVFV